ncbi:diguanylate cyclase [Vibrio sp. Isolate24]|uniref:sensor domain-containing diguanylate cyclase n=1 Tax=Vibrio sp. Isolate24 TaxID=2908534 RepID=UPI001EFD6E5E|nr:diguanylate cyclase [Vibrio sp. Isolate24]MCG9680914.1 diguanylate cyclase [Vibrio sp. Isolate24]
MKVMTSVMYRKYLFYFVSFGLVIAVISSGISFWQFNAYNTSNLDQKVSFQIERSKSAANFFINGLKNNVVALSHSNEMTTYIELPTSANLLRLEHFMLSLIKTNSSIYQLRFIDIHGNEVVKAKARSDHRGTHYQIEPYEQLQNKQDRYYFQVSKDLSEDSYYVSNLDLNKENGVYEVPYRPTLRLITSVKGEDNQFLGAVVANMDATYMLNILTTFEGLDAYLLDGDGYIVFSNHREFNWSRYLGKHATSREILGLSVNDVMSSHYLDLSQILGNNESLRLFVTSSEQLSQSAAKNAFESSIILIVIVSAIAFPLGLLAAYGPAKNSERLAELTKEHKLYSHIVDQYVPIVDTDLKGVITRINDAMCNLSGFRRHDVVGKHSSIFHHNSTQPKDFVDMWQKISDGQSWHGEFHNQQRNGESYWLKSYISPRYDTDGKKVGYISVSSDISDKKILETISDRDVLTGLYNRSKLNRSLESEYRRAERYLAPFSVLLIDIDHFKSINDSYGHLVGDNILVEVSNLLRYNVRQTDCVGRWGGEEFMVICPNTALDEGVIVAEKLRRSIELYCFEEVKNLTISIGVAAFDSSRSIKQMLENADQNLYKAKSSGRNKVASQLEQYMTFTFPLNSNE